MSGKKKNSGWPPARDPEKEVGGNVQGLVGHTACLPVPGQVVVRAKRGFYICIIIFFNSLLNCLQKISKWGYEHFSRKLHFFIFSLSPTKSGCFRAYRGVFMWVFHIFWASKRHGGWAWVSFQFLHFLRFAFLAFWAFFAQFGAFFRFQWQFGCFEISREQ